MKMEDPSNQGALKVLHKPEDARDADLARERIKREISAMSETLHPNLARILHVDPDSQWYVSKYYPHGTLTDKRELFRGDLRSALEAIRALLNYTSRDMSTET